MAFRCFKFCWRYDWAVSSRIHYFAFFEILWLYDCFYYFTNIICDCNCDQLLCLNDLPVGITIFKIFRERTRNQNWKHITNATFFQGTREGIFAFVINIYVFSNK